MKDFIKIILIFSIFISCKYDVSDEDSGELSKNATIVGNWKWSHSVLEDSIVYPGQGEEITLEVGSTTNGKAHFTYFRNGTLLYDYEVYKEVIHPSAYDWPPGTNSVSTFKYYYKSNDRTYNLSFYLIPTYVDNGHFLDSIYVIHQDPIPPPGTMVKVE